MEDNGLIKYYKNFKRGRDLTNPKLHDGFSFGMVRTKSDELQACLTTPEGSYYVKTADKKQRDAEVLLSQVYAKAGLKSAIYLPAGHISKYRCVVSNDIAKKENIVIAKDYFSDIRSKVLNGVTFDSNTIACNSFYMPQKKENAQVDYQKYITPDAMRNLQKARAFDLASFNIDRHHLNYFLKTQGDLVTDVILIDHAMSGEIFKNRNLVNDWLELSMYYSEFFYGKHFKDEIISSFKTNEVVQDFITPQELAESLGSVDILDTARDIRGTIGYKINQEYVDCIAKSFDDTADQLMQH